MSWPVSFFVSVVAICGFMILRTWLVGWLEIRKLPYLRRRVGDLEIEARGDDAMQVLERQAEIEIPVTEGEQKW